jgi:hypothetical protein
MSGPNNDDDDELHVAIQIDEKGVMEPLLPQDDEEVSEEEEYNRFSKEFQYNTRTQALNIFIGGLILIYFTTREIQRDGLPELYYTINQILGGTGMFFCIVSVVVFKDPMPYSLEALKSNPGNWISQKWVIWKNNRKRKPVIKS